MKPKQILQSFAVLVFISTSVFFSAPAVIGKETKFLFQEQTKVKIRKKRVLKSRVYIKGPKGGCYYINSKGRKIYVPRRLCN